MKKRNVRIWAIPLVISSLLSVNACSSAPDIPEDVRPWRIGAVSPSFYPVMVQQAYGVNEQYNWTSLTHGFSHMWRKGELSSARKWLPKYDGYGIPLDSFVAVTQGQVMPAKILPDSMYLYWASLAEGRFYATKFDLSPALKKQMMTRQRFTAGDGVERPCYQNDVVFGLLPGGDAKVWIAGCYKYTYIDRIKPTVTAITDRSGTGVDNFQYKGWIEDTKQRAADHNVTLFPVPWNKVNRVYQSED